MTHSPKSGFTIIEVVLVLALAGLIMTMVFVALPAMQRSQRDTARKSNASAIAAAIVNYRSNNRGADPKNWEAFSSYADNLSSDTETVSVRTGAGSVRPDNDSAIVSLQARCSDNSNDEVVSGTRSQFAVTVHLEQGNTFYCLNS